MAGALGRFLRLILLLLAAAISAGLNSGQALAQDGTTAAGARSEKVKEFVKLLDDPDVRAWLATAASEPAASPKSTAAALAHKVERTSLFRHLPEQGPRSDDAKSASEARAPPDGLKRVRAMSLLGGRFGSPGSWP